MFKPDCVVSGISVEHLRDFVAQLRDWNRAAELALETNSLVATSINQRAGIGQQTGTDHANVIIDLFNIQMINVLFVKLRSIVYASLPKSMRSKKTKNGSYLKNVTSQKIFV